MIKGMAKNVDGIQLMNAVRSIQGDNGNNTYTDRIPVATQENLKDVGKALFDYQPQMNEFLDTLINRIGLVVIRSRSYRNKLAELKRGTLEYGDTIEEVMFDLAKAHEYEVEPPANNSGDVFAQEKPSVLTAFHKVNRENYYKVTINQAMLKRAFTTWGNFDRFVSGVFESLYNADQNDEFLLFKELLGKAGKESYQVKVDMPVSTDKTTITNFSIALRQWALSLEYMTNKYNRAGINNFTELRDQILILKSSIVPVIDVIEVANVFQLNEYNKNMSGRVIVVDDFGSGNDDLLAMIIDRDFSMIYDVLFETNSIYNPQYLYWNYFLHRHEIISSSPWANAIAFTTNDVTSKVNSVKVSPKTASVMQGTTKNFKATIDYVGTPNLDGTWSVEGGTVEGTKINEKTGELTVDLTEPAETSLTVKYTVGEQSDSATVTVTPFVVE